MEELNLGFAPCKRTDNNCPKKENCYRFTCKNHNSAFISFENILNENGECNWFKNNGSIPIIDTKAEATEHKGNTETTETKVDETTEEKEND